MHPDVEAFAAQLDRSIYPFMSKLVRLCPNARLPENLDEFHDKTQAHLICGTFDSDKAALLMLETFGKDVTELTVAMASQMWLWFADDDRANRALAYYRRLPKRMGNFTPEKAQALLARVMKAAIKRSE
jgi:hypothetical protein